MARKPFDKTTTKKTNTERRAQKPGDRKSSEKSESSFTGRKSSPRPDKRRPSGSTNPDSSSKRSFSKDKDSTDKKRPAGSSEKKYFKRESTGFKKESRGEGYSNERESNKRPYGKREGSSYSDKKPGTRSDSTYKGKSGGYDKGPRGNNTGNSRDSDKPRFERKGTFRSTNFDEFEKPSKPQKPEEFKAKGRYSEEKEAPLKRSSDKPDNKKTSRDSEPRNSRFDDDSKSKYPKARTSTRTNGNREEEKSSYKRPSERNERPEKTPYKRPSERNERPEKDSYKRASDRTERAEKAPYKKSFDRNDKTDKAPSRRSFDTKDEREDQDRDVSKSSFSKAKPPRVSSFKKNNADNKPDFEIPKYDLSKVKKKRSEESDSSGKIRLNRYIANAGVCSRREADQIIQDGLIKVNGKVVTEMGYQVSPGDSVKYGSKILNPERQVYILLNKPKDFITTTDDPEDRKTVMHLIANACKERVYPVGRLDRNTTGLLLLTNDGELAKKLTHPSHEIKKVYQAELDKPITKEDMAKLEEG
ncbi:MAG TPA: pseudouridine synthase, partial [Cytophagaceae bacterium]